MIAALHQPLSVGFSSPSEVQIIPAPVQTLAPSFQTLLQSNFGAIGASEKGEENPELSPQPINTPRFRAGGDDPPFPEAHAEYFLVFLNELEAEAPTASLSSWQMSE